jgi:Lrp/AsnC family transcriptional regulator for asnA, asnC and gidA
MSVLDDDLDLRILKILQQDGRVSFTDIAKELDVAVSTVRNRYNNFINQDILKIYGRINPEKVGLNAYARISISVRPKNKISEVINKLKELREISFMASVSGEFDLEVNVMCKDSNHLTQMMHDYINDLDGVDHTVINFYLKVHKFTHLDLDLAKYHQ